jgi:uncharacterized protein (DUF2252 family)
MRRVGARCIMIALGTSEFPLGRPELEGLHVSIIDESPASPVAHLGAAERAAHGKLTRKRVPRSSHGPWMPDADRPDPVGLLEQQAESRVAELVPLRYGRMLASPFTFYRGAALLMASDLASAPRTDLTVQLCGDAHLSNFGVFAAPDRQLVFSLNDFDETLPGPFEWDLKRMVASFAIAGRSRNFSIGQRADIVAAAARTYRLAMREFAQAGTTDVWYARLDIERVLEDYSSRASATQRKRAGQLVSSATAKNSLRAVRKLTREVDGELRFISDPPLVVPIEDLVPAERAAEIGAQLHDVVREYGSTLQHDRRVLLERYRFVHLARKVVGVGSVGTRAWIMLMIGRDNGDPLVLQAKEAQPSVLEPFLGASEFSNHGERVVTGQRLMQSASDIMLGWIHTDGLDGHPRDFYIRQLWDSKASADVDQMRPRGMMIYAELCGWTLARAHARSGDAIAIASYLGGGDRFDRSMAEFAELYADQNERDYAAALDAVASGRLQSVVA